LRQSAGQGAAVHALPADKSAAKKRPAKRKAGKPRGAD